MSSSAERPSAPRVGIIRGAIASTTHVVTDVRRNLPQAVADPEAVERLRGEARDAGYADGYAAGLARADQEAAAARTELTNRFDGAIRALLDAATQLRGREATTLEEVADQAAGLAVAVAGAILQREVAVSSDPGREAIARAMALLPDQGGIRVHLNPDDRALIGPVDDLAPGRTVELVADATVGSGDALVHVGATRIDAQIATALTRVQEVLRS